MSTKKLPSERKHEIVETAWKLFFKNGIANTPVSSIVKEIGVAQGLFYYYFPSKKDVIMSGIELEFEKIEEQMFATIEYPPKSFVQKLIQFIGLEIKLLDKMSPRVFRNMNLSTYIILLDSIQQSIRELNHRIVKRLIEIGKAENQIHIQYSVEILLALIDGFYDLRKNNHIEQNTLLRMIEESLHLPGGSLRVENEQIGY
ncbi:MAG TPA: TetR/AcrR family transcriptional regulator [Caldisericia bacterium]|jgi:AcrR family transcriptional regulator|nr:TetR/AcrR family transcriptional regulator [Caldisericia bacterium]